MGVELYERGIDVSVVLLTKEASIYDRELMEKGVQVIYLSDIWDIYSYKNIFRLIKVLKNFDVVHTHTYSAQLWTAFASYFLPKKIKYVTTEHNTTNRRREKIWFKILDKWMYSRYDEIVSITKEVEENLFNWIKLKRTKKKVIKNGIVLIDFMEAIATPRETLGLTVEDKVIIMVARFNEQKDQQTLIEAMAYLNEKYKLLLVGEGDLLEKCRQLSKKLKIENKIKFLGYRRDIPKLLKMSDVCVLSSYYEGLPISVLEAMASGVPFIGSDVPGIRELIDGAGVLFKRGDSKNLSEEIKKICENPKCSEEVSKRCLEKVKEYSIETTLDGYMEVYG